MERISRKTARFGDLVAAVFDEAALYSTDPLEVSRLAVRAVEQILQHASVGVVPPSWVGPAMGARASMAS